MTETPRQPGKSERQPADVGRMIGEGNRRPQGTPRAAVSDIRLSDDECLRVSLDATKTGTVIDVRIFRRVTMARALMPTSRAVQIAAGAVPAFVEALQSARNAITVLG